MKKSNPNPAPKNGQRNRAIKLGIIGAAVALVIGSVPVLDSISSDALTSDGKFCVQAVSDAGKFKGQSGWKDCGDGDVPIEEPSAPEETPEQVDRAVTFLVERTDLTVQAEQWAGKPVRATVTRVTEEGREVVFDASDTVSSYGYRHFNVVFSSEREADALPFYAPSYDFRIEVGGEVYEHRAKPADFTKATGNGGKRQDWTTSWELTGPDQWQVVS